MEMFVPRFRTINHSAGRYFFNESNAFLNYEEVIIEVLVVVAPFDGCPDADTVAAVNNRSHFF